MVNGQPQIIGARLNAIKARTSDVYDKEQGISTFVNDWISGAEKPSDGFPIALNSSKSFLSSNATPQEKAFAQDFGPNYNFPGEVYDSWVKSGAVKTSESFPLAAYMIAPCSKNSSTIFSNAAQYYISNLAKIIMASSDDDFNSVKASVIEAVNAMDVAAADKEVRDNYTAAQELAKKIQ